MNNVLTSKGEALARLMWRGGGKESAVCLYPIMNQRKLLSVKHTVRSVHSQAHFVFRTLVHLESVQEECNCHPQLMYGVMYVHLKKRLLKS